MGHEFGTIQKVFPRATVCKNNFFNWTFCLKVINLKAKTLSEYRICDSKRAKPHKAGPQISYHSKGHSANWKENCSNWTLRLEVSKQKVKKLSEYRICDSKTGQYRQALVTKLVSFESPF